MTARSQPIVNVVRVGSENEPVVIVDGFVSNRHAHALVDAAAATPMVALGSYYPGLRASAPAGYAVAIGALVGAAARRVFGLHGRLSFDRTLFSLLTTDPRKLTLPQRIPHFDGVASGMIAIVHYLSCEDLGGTSFYRHRSTGFETVTEARHRHYLDALAADFARAGEPAASYIHGDTDLFECIACVPAVFNRAIIYRSGLLHCATIPQRSGDLSTDPRKGRLTIASFLSPG